MKKGLTELVFILDRSGSMAGLENDTIGGFNSMLKKQKEEEGEVIISTVLFDHNISVLHDRRNLYTVEELTKKDYFVGGCTALLDALGGAIKHIGDVQKKMPESERPEKTMFIITTDGQENSSQKYSYAKIKKMVEKKQEKKNWEFLFLGANMDAISVAGTMGIKANRSVRFHSDSVGTAVNYNALSKAVSNYRRCEPSKASCEMALAGWDEEINEDFEARK